MRGAYRMTWPILDARTPLADIIGAATCELRAALDDEGCRQVAPVAWSLSTDPLRLQAVVDVEHPPTADDWRIIARANRSVLDKRRERERRARHSATAAGAAGAQVAS